MGRVLLFTPFLSSIPRASTPCFRCERTTLFHEGGSVRRAPIVSQRFSQARRKEESDNDDPWTTDKLGFSQIGVIIGSHGVRGEMKVLCTSDFPKQRFVSTKGQRYILLPGRRYPRPITLKGGRKATQTGQWIIRLAGYDSPESIREIKGASLYVKTSDRPRLSHGEFLVGDLVGLRVACEDDPHATPIGKISSVILRDDLNAVTSGSNATLGSDILEIERLPESASEGEAQLDKPESFLIPFVRELVPRVDIQSNLVLIRPPSGLMKATKVNRKPVQFIPRGLLGPARSPSCKE